MHKLFISLLVTLLMLISPLLCEAQNVYNVNKSLKAIRSDVSMADEATMSLRDLIKSSVTSSYKLKEIEKQLDVIEDCIYDIQDLTETIESDIK